MKKSQDTQKASEEAIKEFLNNDEDFAAFQYHEATAGDRMAVGGFRSQLAKQGLDLPDGMDEQLVNIMYEERKQFRPTSNLYDKNTFDPAMFTDERIAEQIKEMRLLNQRISSRVSGLLSPGQLEVFQQSQDSMLRMQETSLQMAAKMFRARQN